MEGEGDCNSHGLKKKKKKASSCVEKTKLKKKEEEKKKLKRLGAVQCVGEEAGRK